MSPYLAVDVVPWPLVVKATAQDTQASMVLHLSIHPCPHLCVEYLRSQALITLNRSRLGKAQNRQGIRNCSGRPARWLRNSSHP